MYVSYIQFEGPKIKDDDIYFLANGFEPYTQRKQKNIVAYFKRQLISNVSATIHINKDGSTLYTIFNDEFLCDVLDDTYEFDKFYKDNFNLTYLNMLFQNTNFEVNFAVIQVQDDSDQQIIKHIKKYWVLDSLNIYKYKDMYAEIDINNNRVIFQDSNPQNIIGYNGKLDFYTHLNLTEKELLGEDNDN